MELARVFKDGMVLQRDIPICIWGHSETAQTLETRLNGKFLCETKVTAGEFTIQLLAQSAVEDAVLEIGGITLRHVDIGEVWVASGQSNMEFMLQFDQGGAAEIAAANDPHLRTYIVWANIPIPASERRDTRRGIRGIAGCRSHLNTLLSCPPQRYTLRRNCAPKEFRWES